MYTVSAPEGPGFSVGITKSVPDRGTHEVNPP